MAVGGRIVLTMMFRVIAVAMTIAMPMVLEVMTFALSFSATFLIRHASFDMDMGYVVLRMVVPQGEAIPRYRSRVQQQ
jgi:hypothetical protein